jgi:transposase
MPMRRLRMRKTREILRLKLEHKLSNRDVARSCGVSASTVRDSIVRLEAAGMSWPISEGVDDAELERRLYQPRGGADAKHFVEPNYQHLFRELARRGVTLQLLWHDYKRENGENGYQYSHFTVMYRRWQKSLEVTMRQEHRAGEIMFVDFAGQTMPITDAITGHVSNAQIFVATMGASSYTFALALPDQSLPQWLRAHCRAYRFFGGVPRLTVPDNLRSGVSKTCLYEPDINPAYAEMAKHFGTAVVPARVRKPRDKAKVENGVQQVERWVLAPLRNHKFFHIDELNAALIEPLQWLNARRFAKLDTTRHALFCDVDRPVLKPLPEKDFEIAEWKCDVMVNIDYHVELDRRFYSVPYQLTGKRVDIRYTSTLVEILHKGRRVGLHQRLLGNTRFVTEPGHRPKAHQRWADWSPSRLIKWGEGVGANVGVFISEVLEARPHPEQGYRSCMGVMRLVKRFGPARTEAACKRALALKSYSYKSIESMLRTGVESLPLKQSSAATMSPREHVNIRGPSYYKKDK